MVKGEDLIEKGNKIICRQQERSIEENEEALKLLASERVESEEREKDKLVKELNQQFIQIQEKSWKNPKLVKAMELLGD